MTQEHEDLLKEVYQLIEDIPNEDEDIESLEKAMNYWCGTYDICEGYKLAITNCLDDQYHNHAEEQDIKDLKTLKNILKNTNCEHLYKDASAPSFCVDCGEEVFCSHETCKNPINCNLH